MVQCVLCITLMSFSPLMQYVYSTVELSNWPFGNTSHHHLFPQPSFDVRRCFTETRIAFLRGASSLLLIDHLHDTHHLNHSPFLCLHTRAHLVHHTASETAFNASILDHDQAYTPLFAPCSLLFQHRHRQSHPCDTYTR